jgi:hypothetical protein
MHPPAGVRIYVLLRHQVVSWKPFFLNGSMGGEPQSKRAFYNQKFGEDQFKAMEPSMTRTMKKAGIDVSYVNPLPL